jgi:multidrug efflux pump subunit AcrB
MNEGINELASVVAWWLSHPWQLIGVYLAALAARSVLVGFLTAAFRPRKDR